MTIKLANIRPSSILVAFATEPRGSGMVPQLVYVVYWDGQETRTVTLHPHEMSDSMLTMHPVCAAATAALVAEVKSMAREQAEKNKESKNATDHRD